MKKKFDCVEMKNGIQAKMYEQMKNMTPDEQLEFIHQRAEDFWKKFGKDRPKLEKRKKEIE